MENIRSNLSLGIHRETDVLGLARSQKKKEYWQKVAKGQLPLPIGQTIDYAEERLIYWLKQAEKYRARIEEHIKDFEKIKDPVGFITWIAGVVETIRNIIALITGSSK